MVPVLKRKKFQRYRKKILFITGEVDRNELHDLLQAYDIAFIPLTNRIYGSVPSKVFEFTRLGLTGFILCRRRRR